MSELIIKIKENTDSKKVSSMMDYLCSLDFVKGIEGDVKLYSKTKVNK